MHDLIRLDLANAVMQCLAQFDTHVRSWRIVSIAILVLAGYSLSLWISPCHCQSILTESQGSRPKEIEVNHRHLSMPPADVDAVFLVLDLHHLPRSERGNRELMRVAFVIDLKLCVPCHWTSYFARASILLGLLPLDLHLRFLMAL